MQLVSTSLSPSLSTSLHFFLFPPFPSVLASPELQEEHDHLPLTKMSPKIQRSHHAVSENYKELLGSKTPEKVV